MADEKTGRRGIPLHTKILIGLIVGAVAGVTSNYLWRDAPQLLWIVDNIANPIGQIFLRMLFMVVVPLVFTSLALGVAGLGDLRKLGRIGGKTFGFFLLTTALAVTLGLLLAHVVRPGRCARVGANERQLVVAARLGALDQAAEAGLPALGHGGAVRLGREEADRTLALPEEGADDSRD